MPQSNLLSVDWQQLTSSGDLSYLGAQWRRDVAFAGYNIALQVSHQGVGVSPIWTRILHVQAPCQQLCLLKVYLDCL